jgi:hypothetical protein
LGFFAGYLNEANLNIPFRMKVQRTKRIWVDYFLTTKKYTATAITITAAITLYISMLLFLAGAAAGAAGGGV